MNVSRDIRQELRDLGWGVVRPKAQRPPAVQARDILSVEEDVHFDGGDAEGALVELERHR